MRLWHLMVIMVAAAIVGIVLLVTVAVDGSSCNAELDKRCITENGARYNSNG